MRFLVDAQLPPALARTLSRMGHIAEHVTDVSLRDADDTSIWRYAYQAGACVITKDEDFARRIGLVSDGPPIVWLRIGNCTNGALLVWFMPLLNEIIGDLNRGEKLIEII